ncbi:MAG: LysE family translocator [Bacteroidota bacterium]
MLDPTLLGAFLAVAVVVTISPGPDTLFVIASGLRHRAAGAVAAALGIATGSTLHGLAAALGVSALLAAAPWFFELLRFAGAAYLAWLGFKALRAALTPAAGAADGTAPPPAAASPLRVYRQAVVTNLLNPKVIVFYLALLPQFAAPALGAVGLQIFLLGCIHAALGAVWLSAIGIGSGAAAGWLARRAFARWLDGIAGTVFLGLALRLALGGRLER